MLDRFSVRDLIALMLATSMIALTFVLALRSPESDAFKVLLGAMLTIGFANVIGFYYNSSSDSSKKTEAISNALTKQNETIAAQGTALAASVPAVIAPAVMTTQTVESPDGTKTITTTPTRSTTNPDSETKP